MTPRPECTRPFTDRSLEHPRRRSRRDDRGRHLPGAAAHRRTRSSSATRAAEGLVVLGIPTARRRRSPAASAAVIERGRGRPGPRRRARHHACTATTCAGSRCAARCTPTSRRPASTTRSSSSSTTCSTPAARPRRARRPVRPRPAPRRAARRPGRPGPPRAADPRRPRRQEPAHLQQRAGAACRVAEADGVDESSAISGGDRPVHQAPALARPTSSRDRGRGPSSTPPRRCTTCSAARSRSCPRCAGAPSSTCSSRTRPAPAARSRSPASGCPPTSSTSAARAPRRHKGESLRDTVLTVAAMGVDALVIRHHASGAAHQVASGSTRSVINAGDGTHEHPTQALLDAYTMRSAAR